LSEASKNNFFHKGMTRRKKSFRGTKCAQLFLESDQSNARYESGKQKARKLKGLKNQISREQRLGDVGGIYLGNLGPGKLGNWWRRKGRENEGGLFFS